MLSTKPDAEVLKRISYGANIALPETAPTPFVTRTVIFVKPGSPAPPGVKVIVSRAADHANVPESVGVVRKANCTLLVSIGSLNCRTIGNEVGALAASCAGELLMTTGSSG